MKANSSDVPRDFSSLEASVETCYSIRKPRELLGEEGIIIRTFGANFRGPDSYEPTYFDSRKGKQAGTEFAENIEAIKAYDTAPSYQTFLELALEVGDIMFQEAVVRSMHVNNPSYSSAIAQFEAATNYLGGELSKRGLNLENARRLAEAKYGVRNWLATQGVESKDKELEFKVCSDVLDDIMQRS